MITLFVAVVSSFVVGLFVGAALNIPDVSDAISAIQRAEAKAQSVLKQITEHKAS